MTSQQSNPYSLAGVPNLYTSSTYFKKYYFKVLYNFSSNSDSGSSATNYFIQYNFRNSYAHLQQIKKSRQLIKEVVKDFKDMYPAMDMKFRMEGDNLSVFLANYDDFKTITGHHFDNITNVTLPVNQTQIEMMDDLGASIVFKRRLFKDKYRYKLSLYATQEVRDCFLAIDGVNKTLSEDDFGASTNYATLLRGGRIYNWNLISMYYNDPQDIMMVRLILSAIEHKIEKCALYSEIS